MLEQLGQLLLRYANAGIANPESQPVLPVAAALWAGSTLGGERDRATFHELGRVAE